MIGMFCSYEMTQGGLNRAASTRGAEEMPAGPAVAVDVNDDVAAVAVRTPEPVVIMAGERRRQAVPRAKKVDRGGFTVVACNDRSLIALPRRKRIVNSRYRCGQLRPAVHVCPVLG